MSSTGAAAPRPCICIGWPGQRRRAYEAATRTVIMGATQRHVNWQTVRKWLLSYAAEGRIRPCMRGRNTKTVSFLDDAHIE